MPLSPHQNSDRHAAGMGERPLRTDMRTAIEDRSIPEPNSGCWLWLGSVWKLRGGDRPNIWGAHKKKRFAYRVAFEAFVGPVPVGLYVCHRCDNPMCVNPQHLFLGTHSDNMRDMVRKGRNRPPGPFKHLSAEAKQSIRSNPEHLGIGELARLHGCSAPTVKYHLARAALLCLPLAKAGA